MKQRTIRRIPALLLALALLTGLCGCGGVQAGEAPGPAAAEQPAVTAAPAVSPAKDPAAPTAEPASEEPAGEPPVTLPGLTYLRRMEKAYAEQFDVYYFEGGYKYIVIGDGNRYLLVPEGQSAPAGLDAEIKVLQGPVRKIYLAGSSSMSLFDAMDSLDTIRLSSIEKDAWYVENARAAMERGDILFGGKYSEPDYELLVDSGIDLAIENTMILHTPKVIEMIELLDIPVFIDYSSYESHPLGRTEWVKLFGALIDREEAAEAFFNSKVSVLDEIEGHENTGKTVAIFLIDSTGKAQVRSGTDYLAQIIGIAGGVNAFSGGDSAQNCALWRALLLRSRGISS